MARVLIEEYPHLPGGHCGSTAMRDLVRFHGFDMTEEMAFGLGSGIGFTYFREDMAAQPVHVGGRAPDLELNFCGNLGIRMEAVSGPGPEEGWLAVKDLIDSGVPVMVLADVFHLDYLRAKVHFSAHRIVLVGYDEERGVAYVADNDRDEIQECSLESMAIARSASYPPQPADNTYFLFDVPRTLTPLEEAIPRALGLAVRGNLRLDPAWTVVDLGGARAAFGTEGVRLFAEEMPAWPDSMSAEQLTATARSIYVTAEKGGTGYGGNFRRLYGRFLREAAVALGVSRLDGLGSEFIGIGDLWTSLCLTFKEMSADGAGAVRAAAPVAGEIASRELAAFEALESAASTLGGGR